MTSIAPKKEEAIQWWVYRFVHSQQARDFILQMHGLMPKTRDKKARWKQYVERNNDMMLDFSVSGNKLLIIATTNASQWAAGEITIDQQGKFRYYSLPTRSILENA